MTTVGYGDIAPITPLGQAIAALIMIMGYGIIAVPTGIVTLELNEANRRQANTRICPECAAEGHSREASFCWRCGGALYQRGRIKRMSSRTANLPKAVVFDMDGMDTETPARIAFRAILRISGSSLRPLYRHQSC